MSSADAWLIGSLAAAAAVQAPEPSMPGDCIWGPFLVFFDLDSARISDRAAPILDNVAAAHDVCAAGAPIVIQGHSDRSGPDSHNDLLARRRAESVRAYLSERGIAANAMLLRSFGERRPLVETPDGVPREENRRVEMTFTIGSGW